MANFAQNVNFLHYFLSTVRVLHISLVNSFDCDIPARQFVNRKGDFTESTLADQLDKFVEFKGGLRHRLVFLEIDFVVLD